jgi:hypothetical protein
VKRYPKPVPSAQICVFPPARHKKIVAFIVREMLKQSSLDDAEGYLIDHLNIEWGRLCQLGIADDEIDRHCRDFARETWRAFFKDRDAKGIA